MSMALGEYVSVSAQRDSERRFIEKEQQELDEIPEEELAELAGILEGYGIEPDTARQAATHIHARDPLTVHLRLELGIDPEELTNPWAAAGSSAAAFVAGGAVGLAITYGAGVVFGA